MHDLLIQAACSYNLLGINTSQTEGGGGLFYNFLLPERIIPKSNFKGQLFMFICIQKQHLQY